MTIKKESYKVQMTESTKPIINFKQHIIGMSKLGRELKISPKSHVSVNEEGYTVQYFTNTVSICIGIGKDHTAELIMTVEAWEAFKEGQEISIDTLKEFREKYL